MMPPSFASVERHRSEWRTRRKRRQRCEFGTSRQWMVVRRFISEVERQALLEKALLHHRRGELHPNPSGPGRFFAKVDGDLACYVDPLLTRLTRRCEKCLRLEGVPADCVLGRTISLLTPGAFIHQHTDKYIAGSMPGHRPGYEHLRCNIVVRLPDPSGRPVIEGIPLPVEEGDLWAFFASKSMHETTPLQGTTEPRIVNGFGWSVAPSHGLEIAPEGWDIDDDV
jgi:hypothetical protein